MSNRASGNSQIIAHIVIGFVVTAMLAWAWHSFIRPTHPSNVSGGLTVASDLAAGRAPASIRSAVLYDCYEHARENVPPRNDTSVRANNWRPPPMPLETARAAITDKTVADGA